MHDDRAASAPLAFVIAGALIIGVIATALMTTNDIATPSNTGASVSANRQAQAQGMLQLMMESPSDHPVHLGLGSPGNRDLLDLQMFRSLQRTAFTVDDSTLRYYDDELERLGLVECNAAGTCWHTKDFHLRSYPTLKSAQDLLNNAKDPNLKVVYVGHSETKFSGGAPQITEFKCGKSTWAGNSVAYSIKISNPGSTDTQFQVVLSINNGGSNKITIRDQTGIVAAADVNGPGSTTLTLNVPNTQAAACKADTKYTLSLYGTSRRLVNTDLASPTMSATMPSSVSEGIPILLPAMHALAGEDFNVEYVADKDDVLEWKLYLQDASGLASDCGLLEECKDSVLVKKGDSTFKIKAPAVGVPTQYTLKVEHQQHGATATQRVLVVPDTYVMQPYTEVPGSSTFKFDEAMPIEVEYLDQLVERFEPALQDNTGSAGSADWPGSCPKSPPCTAWEGSGGDVYWDEKKVLTEALPERLEYTDPDACTAADPDTMPDIVVVGSNVDHNAMTSGNFKGPLKDWVVCGGLLIVFGSPEASTQWLQPIFHVGAQSGTGALSTPDTGHPILRVPNMLEYPSYDHRERTWRYTGNAADHFTNVVNQDSAPITAISDPGDFGKGTVLISSWMPYDVFGDGPDAGATGLGLDLLDNFVSQAYRDLFLDYGPPLPGDTAVIPAMRQSQIELSSVHGEVNYHPACGLGTCHVEMTVLLYLW